MSTLVSQAFFLVRMVSAPSSTPLTVLAVAICITCLPWFGVERGGDSEALSLPDPSVELRAQLLEAHRELRGHCETQLATCRRTCPEQKCSLSDWHCWVLLFLVLLAWTVREVIGGFLRGGRGLLKTEPTVRPRLPVYAIRSGRGVLEAPTSC